jgi:transcriptional regulator with XRE-family HTH domain
VSLSPGQRIKHWREIRGLKQNELADLAKIEQSKLCRIEGGKIQARAEDIEQIADALELSMGEFYGEVAEAS